MDHRKVVFSLAIAQDFEFTPDETEEEVKANKRARGHIPRLERF